MEQEREALRQQVDQFRDLADRMTASFNELERRFKALDEEMRARGAAPQQSPGAPPP